MKRQTWRCAVGAAYLFLVAGACGPVNEEPGPRKENAVAELGGVVLEPNTLRGHVRFTNQNPQILQMLDTEQRLWGSVTATSTSPTGYTATYLSPKQPNMRGFDFTMSVEAGAGGTNGVTYTVAPRWYPSAAFDFTHYQFQPATGVKVRPQSVQPQPTDVDFNECVGVIRFLWGKDAACATPQPVTQVWFNGLLLVNWTPQSSLNYYVRGGSQGTANLQYGVQVPDGTNTFTRPVTYNLACDQVVTVCTQVPAAGQLAGFQGPWQVTGENTVHPWLLQLVGSQAYRYAWRTTLPLTAPASDPSTWWKLTDLVPGTYAELSTSGFLRNGRDYTYFRAGTLSGLQAVAGQTSSLVSGGNYPFVMTPSYFQGALRLEDPYVPKHPGAYSSLQGLFFEGDYDSDHDGAPDNIYYDSSGDRYSSILSASDASTRQFSVTSFRGAFDSASGALASNYEQVLPVAYSQPTTWTQSALRLGFWTQGGTFVTKPGQYDPLRYRYGYLDLTQKQRTALLAPGAHSQVDHAYCFNEVQVEYSTQGAPFYNPTATVTGSYLGTDWRGKAADYTVAGKLWGTPAAVGLSASEAPAYAQHSGTVSLTLPQGSYTLTPGATLVNPDGTTSTANFQPFQATLGCGQRLKLVPPLAVSLDALPDCATGATVTASGRVKSGSTAVDRIWYRLNGGPEVTVCTNCGIDPSFQFPAALAACGNSLQVYAYSEGMPEAAFAIEDTVWDDPADGPSCAGATCVTQVNRPPVAKCHDVTVAADGQCLGTASVDDGSYDADPGDTVSCVPSASGPFALGTHPVTLTCKDAAGLSSSCVGTVTVRDTTKPQVTCPADVSLTCTNGVTRASYAASASDNCGASVVCTPASGSTFPAGATTVSCTAVDAAGNSSDACTFPVNVMGYCPKELKVTLCNKPAYTKDPAFNACGYVTSGTGGPPVGSIAFIINGGAPIPVAPTPNNVSSGFVELPVTLQDGVNDIQLIAKDNQGYVTLRQQQVILDRQPPVITVRSLVDEQAIGTNSVVVRSSIEDVGPTRVTTQVVNTSLLPAGGGDVEHTVTFTNRGYVDVTVSATDGANNTASKTVHVWVDFLPPKVTTKLADGATLAPVPGNVVTYTVDVASISATTVTFSNLPGQQFALPRVGGRLNVPMPLQPGANTFSIQATSETGLTATVSRTVNYGSSP